MPHRLSAAGIGRAVLGAATIAFLGIGLLLRGDARWFVAAGLSGVCWTVWDVVWDRVIAPLGEWLLDVFSGAAMGGEIGTRPTLEETIRYLETHIERGAARGVQLQAAVRLEEIYRVVKRDPDRARAVIARMRERFPGAEELARYG